MSKCETCGNEFEAKRSDAKYCSSKCRVKSHRVSVTHDDVTANLSVTDSHPPVTDNAPVQAAPVTAKTPLEELHAMDTGVDLDTIGITSLDLAKDLKLDIRKDLGCIGFSPDGIFIHPDITIDQVRTIRRLVEAKRGWIPRAYDGPSGMYSSGHLITRQV